MSNMNRITIASLVLGMVTTACAGAKAVEKPAPIVAPECTGPAWTCFQSGPCPFPEFSGSLCAVGLADRISSYSLGIEAAKTRARREMAAVLQVQVDGFTRATQDSLSRTGASEDATQKVGDLAQAIVERTLNGVSVPKTWHNPQTNVYFAIAVVDSGTLIEALKGLKQAKGMTEAAKLEIDQRASAIVGDWQAEVARKKAAAE